MNKVFMIPKMELLEGLGLTAYNTVEAEYGNEVIEAIGGGVTLAHHGSRSNNPAPCIAEVVPNDLPILISHVDLDTIGGIMALSGKRDMSDDTEAAFWALAAYVDCHGPHRIHEANAPEKIVRRLNAWYAWSNANRAARAEGVVDMTDYVLRAIEAVKAIIAGDAALLVAGEEWRQTATEQVEARLVDEDERARVFVTDGVFCSSAYYSPKLGKVAKATVALNTKFGSVSLAFEDGGKRFNAAKVAQAIWGEGAGGHAGIAGSPRGQQMTRDDLDKATAYVRGLYAETRCKTAKTVQISVCLGVHPGYGHDNRGGVAAKFTAQLQGLCAAVHAETGVYVPCVVSPTKTIYHTGWGCPVGGEETFSISTVYNPVYDESISAERFTRVAKDLFLRFAKELGQSTATIVTAPIDLDYYMV